MARLPDIPSIGTSEASVGVRRVFDAIRRAFTDINKSGGVETGASVLDKIESAINAGAGDSTTHTPPKPANVVATGGFAYIMVSWDDPHFIHLAYAEVWRSTGTEIIDATIVGTTNATMFSDLPPSQSISVSYNYWVRFVSNDDTPQYGPWSDMVTASTADDPAYILEILSQEIGETELDAALKSKLDGFVADTQELLDTYGDTASAASSASAAVQAAANAVAAQNAASGHAYSASQSATKASTSATSASGAASAANTSASQAATSAGTAGNYASAASLSATTASTNSSSAGAYASSAATSANNAATAASNAVTYASNSSGYAATAVSAASTATAAANTISAQYTIKVDANGKVAGIGLWSGGTTSLVEVVADRFAICNTSGSGKKYPFVVDSTYGVVMDSALIKNGTITNAKIASLAADKLYATSGTIASAIIGYGQITNAMIANAAITTAKIQDLAVGTLKIAGNAVTLAVASYISSGITAQSNTTQVSTVHITTSGQPVIISISFKFASTPNGTINASGAVSCSRSGSTLVSIPLPTYINYANSTTKLAMDSVFTYVYYDYPGAGTYDYTISLSSYSSVPITASARSMYVMEVKK